MADLTYEWDETKRAANLAKHGLDFSQIAAFDLATAVVVPDLRRDYGEARFRVYGYIGGAPCVVIVTVRKTAIRVIGLRRANARERKRHGL